MGVRKKNDDTMFVIRCLFGPFTTYGVIAALIGSIYTNVPSFTAKFPPFVAINLSILQALAISIPLFVDYKNLFFRLMTTLTILISSVFAMNGMNQKDIFQAETRLQQDAVYKSRQSAWQSYNEQLKLVQESVNKYLDLEMTTTTTWAAGAKAARMQRDSLAVLTNQAYVALLEREKELRQKGSQHFEAYVIFIHNFFPRLREDYIMNGSNLLMSFITDLQLTMFCLITVILFRPWVMIPVPRSFRQESRLFGKQNLVRQMFAKCSAIVRLKFGLSSVEYHYPRVLTGTMVRAAMTMLRIRTEHQANNKRISQKEIAYLAAVEMNRKNENGEVLPYGPGFTSDVFRGRYDKFLKEKAGYVS